MSLEARAERCVRELEIELTRRFGWTLLAVGFGSRPSERRFVVSGTVLATRMRELLVDRIAGLLPQDWTLDASALAEHRTGKFTALPGLVRLYRTLGTSVGDELATELLPEDGPVEVLTRANGHTLVRCVDATLGWTADPLGEPVEAPRIAPSEGDAGAVARELERWFGTPYRLGGTRSAGIDCSALVQRCLRTALSVVVPRHSSDQLAFAPRSDPRRPDSGDLLFVWSDQERPCHVGIVQDGSVVHASLSRRSVVRDPLSDFVRGARRVERVEWRAIATAHAEFVGKPSIELPARAARDEP